MNIPQKNRIDWETETVHGNILLCCDCPQLKSAVGGYMSKAGAGLGDYKQMVYSPTSRDSDILKKHGLSRHYGHLINPNRRTGSWAVLYNGDSDQWQVVAHSSVLFNHDHYDKIRKVLESSNAVT